MLCIDSDLSNQVVVAAQESNTASTAQRYRKLEGMPQGWKLLSSAVQQKNFPTQQVGALQHQGKATVLV
jgi:hypothetical protein